MDTSTPLASWAETHPHGASKMLLSMRAAVLAQISRHAALLVGWTGALQGYLPECQTSLNAHFVQATFSCCCLYLVN
jgi:hypothetical protein